MCNLFEFVHVKGIFVIRFSELGTSLMTVMAKVMTYASIAAPVHASWGIDLYRLRENCQLHFRHSSQSKN
jgi:hypothetical protein